MVESANESCKAVRVITFPLIQKAPLNLKATTLLTQKISLTACLQIWTERYTRKPSTIAVPRVSIAYTACHLIGRKDYLNPRQGCLATPKT